MVANSVLLMSVVVLVSAFVVNVSANGFEKRVYFNVNAPPPPPPITKRITYTYNAGPPIDYFKILDQTLAAIIRLKQDKIASLVREKNRITEANKRYQEQAATAKPVTYTFEKKFVPQVIDININKSFSYGKPITSTNTVVSSSSSASSSAETTDSDNSDN